jgi:hypothetical protein
MEHQKLSTNLVVRISEDLRNRLVEISAQEPDVSLSVHVRRLLRAGLSVNANNAQQGNARTAA